MTDIPWSQPEFQTIMRMVSKCLGQTLSQRSHSEIEACITRSMHRNSTQDLKRYLELLESKQIPLDELINEFTIGETYFFRDPNHFEYLRTYILPEIKKIRGADHMFRIWSAGCASGEEAYSLAILLEEQGLAAQGQILATDISQAALAKALVASYRSWSLRAASPNFLHQYFQENDENYLLTERIKNRVRFEYLNLAGDMYPSFAKGLWGMDIIFCRNVLIYFDQKTIKYVAQHLYETLAVDGWLITGPSDPPLSEHAPFKSIITDNGVYWRRSPAAPKIFFEGPKPSLLAEAESKPWQKISWNKIVSSKPVSTTEKPVFANEPKTDNLKTEKPKLAEIKSELKSGNYSQVIELTKDNLDSPNYCALHIRALANLNGAADAEARVVQALKQHPLSAELRYLRTLLLMELSNDQEALKEVNHVLYLDRSLLIVHYTHGLICQRLGDLKTARKAFRNIVELGTSQPQDHLLELADGEKVGRLIDAAKSELAILKDS